MNFCLPRVKVSLRQDSKMGCDGGTIPRRDELVRTKKKKEAKDKNAETIAKWKYCAVSSNKLAEPIVSCELGRLYNKDAIIEYLLNKESPNSSLVSHIRGLKDIVTLNLTVKQGYDEKTVENGESSHIQDSKYVCPVIGLEMNGNYKFYYFRSCGCVVSERAIKELKSETCLSCNKPVGEDDLIVLNGSDEEVESLRQKMEARRTKAKEERKSKRKLESKDKVNGRKEQKVTSTEPSSSKTSNAKTSSTSLISDKLSKDYSISKDANASETYKSLFTTHESAKNRPKAHWVTFNPCYN